MIAIDKTSETKDIRAFAKVTTLSGLWVAKWLIKASMAMGASLEREVLGTEGFSDDALQRMAAVLIKTQTH